MEQTNHPSKDGATIMQGAVETVQNEVGPWCAKQKFQGEWSPDRDVLGVVEEAGELCAALLKQTRERQIYDSKTTVLLAMAGWLGRLAHVELKSQQGIRHTPEEALAIELDAFGQLSQLMEVYITGYTDDIRAKMRERWLGTDKLDGPSFPPAEVEIAVEAADVIVYMSHLAHGMGFHLGAALLSRWERVRRRDWATDPVFGGESKEAFDGAS